MTNEDKIKKWLAGELSDSERKEFESSEEFAELKKLLKAVQHFKAPEYDVESEYNRLTDKALNNNSTLPLYERIRPVLKIAAIIIVALTIGYFSYMHFLPASSSPEWISAQTELYLPDSSFVSLNTGSRVRYAEKKWKRERNVQLEGEAFFSVKEGSQFHVITRQGRVTVLGTEFTVKDRENYFQVTCYSGSVQVVAQKNSIVLQPQSTFRIMNGKEERYAISDKSKPDWLRGESSFRSMPLSFVIDELERQYEVSVETRNVDENQLFTGSFTHDDLETALKAITLPVNLNYGMNEDKIVITVEGK